MSDKFIIRAKTFEAWFKANLREYASDIASHGADSGWPFITYTRDTVHIYDKFEDDIWSALEEDADQLGYKNIPAMIADFNRVDMAESSDGFKNLLVWYMCERTARNLQDQEED